jgi:hypothetical protein
MNENELLKQVTSNQTIMIIALMLVMLVGFGLVLFDNRRTHKTQLEFGYNALSPSWQGLLRALVLKGKDAVDYLDDATDGTVGGRSVADLQKEIDRLNLELAQAKAKLLPPPPAEPPEPDTRPVSQQFGTR